MAVGRAMWKGPLRFNMVVVPVAAYTVGSSEGSRGGISFNQIHKGCNQRIRMPKTCPTHGELKAEEIVKGYEFTEGQYIIIDPAEIDKLKTKGEKALNVEAFVGSDTIDPRYLSGSHYYLMPDGPVAAKPYAMLVRAMREAKRHAFATVFFANADRLMLIRPLGKVLVMSELSYAQAVKDHHEFEGDVPDVDLPANEMKLAKTLVDAMTGEVDLADYRDKYSDDLRALVEAKVKGEELVPVADAPEEPRTINLMQALEESLKAASAKKSKKPAKLVAPSPAAAAAGRKRKTS